MWEPIGEGGRVEVAELLAVEALPRYFAQDQDVELELAGTTIAGRSVEVAARWQRRLARCDGAVLAELDLSGAPDPTGGYRKVVRLDGSVGSVLMQADESRRSRLRGTLRFLRVEAAGRTWVWHFEGGRAAGERLVLSRGRTPGDGEPLVTTHPAARGRALGNPTGGATVDTHVTSWTPAAGLGDVVLAELLACARLDSLVDYRPSRIAEGVGELIDLVPRPEPNTG
ncbi:hypothetical protein [Nocardioides pocheonensis]|uniref:Uncharacterized protein n=1 Tax=Nocardioides pocheonensis TaxID=661485 RepID=A0A3N0GR75_9ACTN|nr:hypothetical protein [Nocardioides pocheonensis]RNM14957.1 hypothetical protein EFL26_09585 [Nocardioides pocheonensis]